MKPAVTSIRRVFCGCSLLFIAAALALTGCDAKKSKDKEKEKSPQTETKLDPSAVKLETVSKEGFEKAVASHKGKVVLVDFWATWCGPCVKQFPHTVHLAHKYKDKGLDVLTVSVDKTDDVDEVRKFLSDKGTDIENLITDSGDKAIGDYDVDNGAIPCYWIYDREGNLAERISPADPTKKFTPQIIDDAIERLLAAPAADTPANPAAPTDADKPAQQGASSKAGGKFNKAVGIGDTAPDWSEVAGVDGANHSLQDYKDAKVMVQVFTCNNCPVAVAYEDRLVQLARDYKDRGVTLVAINCKASDDEQLPKMKERSVAKGFTFDYLQDASQKSGRAYGAKVTPEVFVLDGNRKVIYMGAIDDSWDSPDNVKQAYLRDAIDAALAGKAPEITETKAEGCSIVYE